MRAFVWCSRSGEAVSIMHLLLLLAAAFGPLAAADCSQEGECKFAYGSDGTPYLLLKEHDGGVVGRAPDGTPMVHSYPPAGTTFSSALRNAAIKGDETSIRSILSNPGIDVNDRDESGRTALHWACSAPLGTSAAVQALIDAGAIVNARSNFGTTPLMMACNNDIHPDVIETLLSAGANVYSQNTAGNTALLYCAEGAWPQFAVEKVQLLIDARSPVNVANNDGKTALSFAVKCKTKGTTTGQHDDDVHLHIVDLLLEKAGACINHVDKDGHTAIEMVRSLLLSEEPSSFDDTAGGEKTFSDPCVRAMYERLLDAPVLPCGKEGVGAESTTALPPAPRVINEVELNTAIIMNDVGAVSRMLQSAVNDGAVGSVVNEVGSTPLNAACWFGSMDIALLVLGLGVDVNKSNKFGVSPLGSASGRGHLKLVNLLLDHGANVNHVDNGGNSALSLAANAPANAGAIVERLRKAGAKDGDAFSSISSKQIAILACIVTFAGMWVWSCFARPAEVVASHRQCAAQGCSKKGMMRCSECRSVRYCSEAHQKLAWPDHKLLCASWKTRKQQGSKKKKKMKGKRG